MRENNLATLSRPLGVTVIAVVWTLLSVFGIWGASYFIWHAVSGGLTAVESGEPGVVIGTNVAVVLVFLIQLAFSVGLFRMRNWARRVVRFFAALTVLTFLFDIFYYASFGEDLGSGAANWTRNTVTALFDLWAWFYLGRQAVVACFLQSGKGDL